VARARYASSFGLSPLVFVICAANANCAADAQEEGTIGGLNRRRVFPVVSEAMN
jgi:hypothetical protein